MVVATYLSFGHCRGHKKQKDPDPESTQQSVKGKRGIEGGRGGAGNLLNCGVHLVLQKRGRRWGSVRRKGEGVDRESQKAVESQRG